MQKRMGQMSLSDALIDRRNTFLSDVDKLIATFNLEVQHREKKQPRLVF